MRMDATSSTSSSPSAYEYAVPIKTTEPVLPQKPFKGPARRYKRAESYSSSNTSSSGPSLCTRLHLNIPRPASTCGLVEADVHPNGCFTPTSPVYSSLRSLADTDKTARRMRRLPIPRFLFHDYSRESSPTASADSAPTSPTSAFSSIPSISRTVSFDEPEARPPALIRAQSSHARSASLSQLGPAPAFKKPHSLRPATTPSSPRAGAGSLGGDVGMDPILAAAEDASRLRTNCVCSMCGRVGANFPRSARTGDVWCSRECRVAAREQQREPSVAFNTQPIFA